MESQELEDDGVFESAAELFRAMAAPMRLKIISTLCNGEKKVSELLAMIDTTQPNMSQHLNTLYQAGVLGRRTPKGQVLQNDSDFCRYLLDDFEVAVVPGSVFGLAPYFRISYATSMAQLQEACQRIAAACKALT